MGAQDKEGGANARADKQAVILQAALSVFCSYGYRRTSMEDIAQAAMMSRPALYQHFRNKEAIARQLVAVYYDTATQAVSDALSQPGSPDVVLSRAFSAKMGPEVQQMLDSPHGTEMLDIKGALAQDLAEEGLARIEAIFADWLAREASAGRIVLDDPAHETARSLLRLLDALKELPYSDFATERERLARLIGRGLMPRPSV